MAGLAYVWARAGFAAHAAVLLGVIGLRARRKALAPAPIERATEVIRPALATDRWETLRAHGSGLDLAAMARLLLARTGPYDVPASILPILTTEDIR